MCKGVGLPPTLKNINRCRQKLADFIEERAGFPGVGEVDDPIWDELLDRILGPIDYETEHKTPPTSIKRAW